MQAYALLHFHTPSVAPIINHPALYRQFLAGPDDHSRDYLGNGERMLPYLPGYAIVIAQVYALAGRMGIIALQSLLVALTAALLFAMAKRTFHSRWCGIFAALAYATTVPAFHYAGQIFPSTVATCVTFAGLLLAVTALPNATGRRLLLAAGGVGPWSSRCPGSTSSTHRRRWRWPWWPQSLWCGGCARVWQRARCGSRWGCSRAASPSRCC
jgi:hypothetical protein